MELPIFEHITKSEPMRALIVDDEANVREALSRMLGKYCPQVELVGSADGLASGIKAIHELHPDLILLDIELDDGSGFDLIRMCGDVNFKVIFITAYEKYAVQAFKFSAIDFLLKPINPEELADAVIRAENLTQQQFETQVQALEENLRTEIRQHKKIILRTAADIHLVELQDIVACESDGGYTVFHTLTGEKIMVTKTLREFEDMLGDHGFFRVHKSFLINLSHIHKFGKKEGGYIVLTGDLRVPVASRKRDELLEVFEKLT